MPPKTMAIYNPSSTGLNGRRIAAQTFSLGYEWFILYTTHEPSVSASSASSEIPENKRIKEQIKGNSTGFLATEISNQVS